MRLGKNQKSILQWLLIVESVNRQFLYEQLWPDDSKTIVKQDTINLLSQAIKSLKDRKLINEKNGFLFLTSDGISECKKINRKEMSLKPDPEIGNKEKLELLKIRLKEQLRG